MRSRKKENMQKVEHNKERKREINDSATEPLADRRGKCDLDPNTDVLSEL